MNFSQSIASWKTWHINANFLGSFYLVVTLVAIFIIPDVLLPTRLENIFIPLLIGSLFFFKRIRFNWVYGSVILTFFIATLIPNLLYYDGLHGVGVSYRYLKGFLLFVLVSQLVPDRLKLIDSTLKALIMVMLVVNVIQIFNPFDLGVKISSFYTLREQFIETSGLLGKAFRLIGTTDNPNNNGIIWLGLMCYFMARYFFSRANTDLLYMALAVLVIILTQSRTNFIALSVISLLYVIQFKLKKRVIFGMLLATAGIFSAIYYLNLGYLSQLFENNPFKIHSLFSRFPVWENMIELWKVKQMFGWGVIDNAKQIFSGYPDNEAILILVSFGAVGLVLYLIMMLFPVIYCWSRRKTDFMSMLGILLPIGLLINGLTNFAILNVRIGLLYFFFMALAMTPMVWKQQVDLKKNRTA